MRIMNQEKLKGNLAMFFTAIIFGINIPFSKALLPYWMSAEAMIYSRFLFGALSFWLASLFIHAEHVPIKDLALLLLGSVLGIAFNQGFFIEGLLRTSPSDASIVTTITPILVLIISFIFLKEPITFKKTGGVLLGFLGVIIIIVNSDLKDKTHHATTLGDLLCIGSSLAYAFFLVVTRAVSKRYHPITIMKWMFLFSALLAMPWGLHDTISAHLFSGKSLSAWGSFIYMLVGATFITYLLIPFSQKRIRPTTIGMYNYLQPLMASIVSITMGSESFSWIKPVAAMLIFAGVYLVTTSKSKEDLERLAIGNKAPATSTAQAPLNIRKNRWTPFQNNQR
ncbi:MAG: DMT family transporter [Microbacter sp.]